MLARSCRWVAMATLTLLLITSTSSVRAATTDWPQFLGPQRNGISSETGLMKTWPAGGPKVLWRVKGGIGMTGVVVVGKQAFTMVQRDGKQLVTALNADTGKSQWATPIADAYMNGQGPGPRATPTVSGKLLFAFSGDGKLVALKIADGSVVWSRDVVKENQGKIAEYGMTSSPLVVGKHVVVTAGCRNATVVAYQTATGEPVWRYPQSDPAGYSSPALLTVAGRPQIVAVSGSSAFGLDPRSGRAYWRYPFVTDFNCNIATPVQIGKDVFISSGENHGCALLGFKPAADGYAVEERWKSFGPRSVMRNEWQTSLLIDGHLYGFDNVGGAGPISHLSCLNAKTGERTWRQVRFGKGNMIAADGKFFMTTMKGELVVAKINSKEYQEIGRMELLGPTRQAPALSQGRLFMRDNEQIICVSVK